MMMRWFLGGVLGGAVLLSSMAWAPGLASKERTGKSQACRSLIVGTFLTTQLDSNGVFATRSLFTFHDDGTLAAVLSRQTSGEAGTAFSSQLGSYSCSSRHSAVAIAVDFGFPPDQDIGRFDMTVAIDRNRNISGTIVLTLLTPLDSCDPFHPDDPFNPCTESQPFDFTFTGFPVPSKLN
ncbi:MAG: hypothetical protein AAF495_29550 [Pseudomonadota bacterium]